MMRSHRRARALILSVCGLALLLGSFFAVRTSAVFARFTDQSPASRTDCTWGPVTYRDAVPYLIPGSIDTHATFWSYGFDENSANAAKAIRFTGQFPYARYMSLIAYDEAGNTVAQLLDAQILPDAGSQNPYLPGVNRSTPNRSFTVWMARQGGAHASQPNNTLVIPAAVTTVDVLLRVYLPDNGQSYSGGVALPQIAVVDDASGQSAACPTRRYPIPSGLSQRLGDVSPYFQTQTISTYRITGAGWQPDGSNPYLITLLLRQNGKVAVLRFRTPTTPVTTPGGGSFTGQEQARYWSVCLANPKTTGAGSCVYDEQPVKSDDNNQVTIVVGPSALQARAQSMGMGFMPWGPEASASLLFRQIIPSPSYAYPYTKVPAIDLSNLSQQVAMQDRASNYIGDYAPQGHYCDVRTFERTGCA